MSFTGLPIWGVALIVAASAGALALLHLLRIRPRPVRVVTTLFWAQISERARARSLLERFRHPLTYLLLLLICALIALALGRPEATSQPAGRMTRVFVLDAGAASAAQDGTGVARLQRAAARIQQRVAAHAATDPVSVIAADPWPRLLCRFDDPRPVIARRLSELRSAEIPAAIEPAVRLARSLVRGRSNGEVELFRTGGRYGREPTGPTDAPVRVVHIGQAAPNAAVIAAAFEPDADNPLRGTFRVRLGAWESDQTVGVRIGRDGAGILLEETRDVPAGGTADVVVDGLAANGDLLRIDLISDDTVDADDRWTFRLPLRGAVRVRLGRQTGGALSALLQAAPELVPASDGRADIEIIAGEGPVDSSGPTLVIVDGPNEIMPGLEIRPGEGASLARGLTFGATRTAAGPALTSGRPLLVCGGGVLASRVEQGGRRQILISRALLGEGATAPREPGFAVFLVRAIRHLAGWSDAPLVLPPLRAMTDPLWAERALAAKAHITPAGRFSGDVSVSEETGAEVDSKRRSLGRPFELLLMLAGVLALAEALLHVRGRIP